MTKVAIVILNWNGKNYLEKFLPSVLENSNTEGCKIFVADNGSTDSSILYMEENFPEVTLIRLDKNYGFALGYVKALEQISAEYFVLLNSDVEVSANWLQPLIKMMDEDKSVAACMPKIKSFANKEYFEYSGAAGGFIDKFGYPFCRGRILDVIEKDNGQYDNFSEVFWASGACMFVRSEAYYKADGLDGDFFAHMEEIDLCWRMKKNGYKIMFNPLVEIFHVGGGTLPNNTPRKLFFNYRNSLFLLFKNLPPRGFIPTLIIRIGLDIASSMIYLVHLQPAFTWAVIKAHFSFYFSLPSLIRKRHNLQKITKNYSVGEVFNHSILKEFFIRKKRYFHQINFLSSKL
jgi:GT2 family glycosyltransferase